MVKLSERSGRYGSSKYKAFKALQLRNNYTPMRTWCIVSGLGYRSLARHASRWCKLGYVRRRICSVYGYGDYEYELAPGGIAWLEYAKSTLPMASTFDAELTRYVESTIQRFDELESLPFKEFVSAMHELSTR